MVFFNKNAKHMLQVTHLIAPIENNITIILKAAYAKSVDSSDYLNLKR